MESSKKQRALNFLKKIYYLTRKSWKYLQVVVTLIIWFTVAYFIFYEQEQLLQIINHTKLTWEWIGLAILLLPVNIGLEAWKWYWMIREYYRNITYFTAYQAILAGAASAFITPQKLGDYIGRLLYLSPEHRISAALVTFLDRLSQLGATLLFMVFASYYLNLPWLYSFFLTIFTILFHCFLWTFPRWFPWFNQYIPKIDMYVSPISIKLQVLTSALSVLRFTIFLAQYILIFKAFGVPLKGLWALCCFTFFIKSFIPSLAFSELGIREGVAIWVFSHYSNINTMIVLQATFILFIINTLIPATLGGWLIKNFKI